MIRALIVDDEPLARQHVASLLRTAPDFEAVGEAGHGAEAVEKIAAFRPDLVFLDIQMPEMSGFDVIAAIGIDDMPPTVFVTAYDAYAIQAFEVQALDYLLKPFDDLRFAKVLDRARKQTAQTQTGAMRNLMQAMPPKLVAKSRGVVRVIHLEDIDWIGAAGDYAEVHTQGRSLLIDESLTSLAERLLPEHFARIHRTTIVRLDRIKEVQSGTHGDGTVRLKCDTQLRISRRYRAGLSPYLST